ncbi:MAG: hypothetical protein ACQES9_10670 [Myxococcota bacterium]
MNSFRRINYASLMFKIGCGFSYLEIIAAVAVFAILAIPIYQTMHNVQSDTSKSINYFRAMELANEAIEYVKLLPVDDEFKMKAEGISGSLLVERPSSLEAAKIPAGENPEYSDILQSEIQYSSQYNPAHFYRTVEVADLSGNEYSGFLKKVVVTVYWESGVAINNLHDPGNRSKKVVLASLITNWTAQP